MKRFDKMNYYEVYIVNGCPMHVHRLYPRVGL